MLLTSEGETLLRISTRSSSGTNLLSLLAAGGVCGLGGRRARLLGGFGGVTFAGAR